MLFRGWKKILLKTWIRNQVDCFLKNSATVSLLQNQEVQVPLVILSLPQSGEIMVEMLVAGKCITSSDFAPRFCPQGKINSPLWTHPRLEQSHGEVVKGFCLTHSDRLGRGAWGQRICAMKVRRAVDTDTINTGHPQLYGQAESRSWIRNWSRKLAVLKYGNLKLPRTFISRIHSLVMECLEWHDPPF